MRHLLDYVTGYEEYCAESPKHAVIMAYCRHNGIVAYDVQPYIEEHLHEVIVGRASVCYRDYSCMTV